MSYSGQDTSAQSGSPVYLLMFVQGDNIFRYTTSARDMQALGEEWESTAVTLGSISQSNDMHKDGLSLKFPRDHEFAKTFLAYSADSTTSVALFRGHTTDVTGEFLNYWKGRVLNVKASDTSISLECEPIFTSMRRPGLRARYQRTCRHALYQFGCGVDPEAHGVSGLCTAASADTLIIPEAANLEAGFLIGGMVKGPDGSFRYVVNHVGDTLTLMRPLESIFRALELGGYGSSYGEYYGGINVVMYPGCDHSKSMCASRFNNVLNYGGFPWIPGKNPFGGSSIV